MCDHNHDHNHDCCDHGDDEAQATAYSLYKKIDLINVECLNEKDDDSGIKVFKPWSERMDNQSYVESDCDAELIYNIPFTGDVKLKGIIVIGDENLSKIRLYKSKMRMSFDNMGSEADQQFEVRHDPGGLIEYPIKPTKFSNVHHLTIHFTNHDISDDSNPCRIYYIGLKGEFTDVRRDGIVIANYEVRPTEDIHGELSFNAREIQ